MHCCHEEGLAFMSLVPFAPILVLRIRAFFHKKKPCAHEHEAGAEVHEI